MFMLRILLCILLGGCATIDEPKSIYLDPPAIANCPTEDIGGWIKTNNLPAEQTEWIVSAEISRQTCTGIGNGVCGSIGWEVYKDGIFYGRVWSPYPLEFYTPTQILHELCHNAGWTHGRHAQRVWTR